MNEDLAAFFGPHQNLDLFANNPIVKMAHQLQALRALSPPSALSQATPAVSGPSGGSGGAVAASSPSIPSGPIPTGAGPADQVALAVKYGQQYGVDPKLLLAIAKHETNYGALGLGRSGYTLGYGATDSGNLSQYAGVENQYSNGARTLAAHGVHSLADVQAGKARWWATDPAWAQGVSAAYGSQPPANGQAQMANRLAELQRADAAPPARVSAPGAVAITTGLAKPRQFVPDTPEYLPTRGAF